MYGARVNQKRAFESPQNNSIEGLPTWIVNKESCGKHASNSKHLNIKAVYFKTLILNKLLTFRTLGWVAWRRSFPCPRHAWSRTATRGRGPPFKVSTNFRDYFHIIWLEKVPISAAPSLESAFNLLHIKLAFEPGLSILEIGMIVCMSRIINF